MLDEIPTIILELERIEKSMFARMPYNNNNNNTSQCDPAYAGRMP